MNETSQSAAAPIDPAYSIGIAEMDVQHAHWIKLIQQFRAVADGRLTQASGIQAARQTLEELLAYSAKHFASEEQLMAAHHFPGLDAHKQKHRELAAQVKKLHDEIVQHKGHTAPLKLNIFVTIWLMEHIVKEDMQYARFILGK